MAEERVPVLKFSSSKDEFNVWLFRAEAYAERFGFASAMGNIAEADLPEKEGPGTTNQEQAAVERNWKAVSFNMSAMPNSLMVNLMAASKLDPKWPNQAKAHLMMAYLKETYVDTSTLLRIRVKRDLDACVMRKDENPKILSDKLVAVQYKYSGLQQAKVSEDDQVAQAIQALPTMYNSTVAGLIKTEQRAGKIVTLAALKKAVNNYYGVAMKGKSGNRTQDIEGGLMTVDDGATTRDDELKKLIQDAVSSTVKVCQLNHVKGGQQVR
jgi:hypothetical protein